MSRRVAARYAGLHNLTPDEMVTVYHGTRLAHVEALINGFDANNVRARDYGGPRHAGLFVTPDLETAVRFSSRGEIIFELEVRAKNLHGTDFSGNIGRRQEMSEKTRKFMQKDYPDSFRPYLSVTMLQKSEPQALLLGLVRPSQIKRVRYQAFNEPAKWYTRSEFTKLGLEAVPFNGARQKPIKDLGVNLAQPRQSLSQFLSTLAVILDIPLQRVTGVVQETWQSGRDGAERVAEIFSDAGFGQTATQSFLRQAERAWGSAA